MTRPDALAPLRVANFRWYFASRFVNMVGGTMASVALAFAVLEVSDSPRALGTVLAANSIPMVVFLLAGGVIADRFGRTLVIQCSNLVAGTCQLGDGRTGAERPRADLADGLPGRADRYVDGPQLPGPGQRDAAAGAPRAAASRPTC